MIFPLSHSLSLSHPVFGEELGGERPGGVADDLVDVATVANRVVSLVLVHHREALELVRQIVTAHWAQGGKRTCICTLH